MAGTAQFNEVTPIVGMAQFNSSYVPPAQETIVSPAPYAGRVDQLLALNKDTAAHVATVLIFNGSTSYYFGSVSIPAGAGFLGVAPVDVIAALLPSTQPFILMPAGFYLQAFLDAAPGATTYVQLTASGGTL